MRTTLVLLLTLSTGLSDDLAAQEAHRVSPGDRVRVWPVEPRELQPDIRLLTPVEKKQEGTLLALDSTALILETDSRIATLFHIGIGHWETEHEIPLERIRKLEVSRGTKFTRPSARRALLGAGAGLALGLLLANVETTCGGRPCTRAQRNWLGGIVGGATAAAILFWPHEVWEEVPLPGRAAPET